MIEHPRTRAALVALLLVAGLAVAAPNPAGADQPPDAGYLVGTVSELFGRGTQGATVTLDLGSNNLLVAEADVAGNFDFAQPIPAGQYWVTAYGCDPTGTFCDDDVQAIDITHTATANAGFMLDYDFGSVGGTVTEALSRPIADGTVEVRSGETVVATAEIAFDGGYDIGDLATGDYTATARGCTATGVLCATETVPVTVENGQSPQLDIEIDLGFAIVIGIVTGTDGEPLIEQLVSISVNGAAPMLVLTDEVGGFLVEVAAGSTVAVSSRRCDDGGCASDAAEVVEVENGSTNVLDLQLEAEATAPGAPGDVSAVAGDGQVTVSWSAPADDGGSAITGYEVTVEPGGTTVAVGAEAVDAIVTGLTNGTPHTATVRAVNAVGQGPASSATSPVVPMPVTCDAEAFTDVGADHPFCVAISWMAAEELAAGFPDGSFGTATVVDRMQLAAFLYRLSGSPNGADPACTGEAPFSDVGLDHPFCGEIQWLAGTGVTQGYGDDTFRPAVPVSRMAVAAFLYRAWGSPEGVDPTCTGDAPFSDVGLDHPFCGEIAWLVEAGITDGFEDGTFRPGSLSTRQALAAQLYRAVQAAGRPPTLT